MSVRCAKCGEELLGAVNRCWRCGEVVLSAPPPVRAIVVEPEVIAVPAASAGTENAETPIRIGSPFSAADDAPPIRRPLAQPRSIQRTWALGGGIGSLLLGLISIVATWYIPYGPLFTSTLGLLLGIWGLYAERRGPAVIGLFLCCISLAISGFFTVVEVYTHIKGVSPFEVLSPPLGN